MRCTECGCLLDLAGETLKEWEVPVCEECDENYNWGPIGRLVLKKA